MANSKKAVKFTLPHRNYEEVSTAPGTYAQLADFNEICTSAVERLEEFTGAGMLQHAELAYYGAMLCEIRAAVSQSVADSMRVLETEMQALAQKRRIKLERRLIK